jgi:DNA-binding NtrC family response regulator
MFETIHILLKADDLQILSAATYEQAVAVCVAHVISLAIVDSDSVSENQWSVAQSLKMVRPGLPIVLVEKEEGVSGKPEGFDAVISLSTIMQDLPNKVRNLLENCR